MAAVFAFFTGLYTVLTNRPSRARPTGRKMGLITVGVSVALIIGSVLAPPAEYTVPTAVAGQTASASAEPTKAPSPAPTTSATSWPPGTPARRRPGMTGTSSARPGRRRPQRPVTPVTTCSTGTKPGANVVHKGNAKVHVSGHASAGELVYCYNLVRPRNVIPADYVYVENMVAGAATEESLLDRIRLAEDGAVTVLAIVNADTGRLEENPEFFPVGFAPAAGELEKATGVVEKTLAGLRGEKTGPDAERAIAEALVRWSDRALRRKPVVTVIIVDA